MDQPKDPGKDIPHQMSANEPNSAMGQTSFSNVTTDPQLIQQQLNSIQANISQLQHLVLNHIIPKQNPSVNNPAPPNEANGINQRMYDYPPSNTSSPPPYVPLNLQNDPRQSQYFGPSQSQLNPSNFLPYPNQPQQCNPNAFSQFSGQSNMFTLPSAFASPQFFGQPLANSSYPPDFAQVMTECWNQYLNKNVPTPTSQSSRKPSSSSEEESDYDTCDEDKKYENPFYKEQLENHYGSKQTLNILVLGETGVGKSTWINGIANYMSFDTLEEALKAPQPICLISSKFSVHNSNGQRVEVKIEPSRGGTDENEVLVTGQSSTQDPKTYQFQTSKYIVNIIDTPGIGDTRGPSQDKENTKKILNAISTYDELHAICFLFKANEARMTQSFRYCIGELLLQLHKGAINNIICFFTNARGTFYKAGDTMDSLLEFLQELEDNRGLQIKLTPDKICCTDNEAFRLVCAHYNGITFTNDDFKNFSGSWKKSAEETHRFIEFAARQRPHLVADTLCINKARTIIYYLAKPLADVNQLIESNVKVFNDRKEELKNTADNIEDLKQKLMIPQIGIQVKELDYPKTVCASTNCIETQLIPNTDQQQTIFKQICHDHCFLSRVEVEKVPDPHIKNCAAMFSGKCRHCNCMWYNHMHIRYDQIKTAVMVEDENIKNAIRTNEDAAITKQKMIDDCEEQIEILKSEQQQVIQTSLKFGSFLQTNAILPYNDAFEKYVEQTVEEEEKCTKIGGDRTKLDNLKKLLAEYRQEKKLLIEASMDSPDGPLTMIDINEIEQMKEELFKLDHCGKILENLFKATADGIFKHNNHIIIKYTPSVINQRRFPYEDRNLKKDKTKAKNQEKDKEKVKKSKRKSSTKKH